MKKWISFDSDEEEILMKITIANEKKSKNNANNVDYLNGTDNSRFKNFNFEKYVAPKTKEDLAIHSKKIKELEDWISENVLNRPVKSSASILLITGPTGSAKTTAVTILCKDLEIELIEWVNPIDHDYETFKGPGQVTQFMDFLVESKYPSLLSSTKNMQKIVLVKDFPNAFIQNPSEFHSAALEKCSYLNNLAVIFICTETGSTSLDLSRNLFPDEIREKYSISKISFNPCPTTILKNALKRVQTLLSKKSEDFKTPSQSTIDAILASSMGDIRSAVNQYNFACLRGIGELPAVLEQSPVGKTSGASKSHKRKRKDEGGINKIKSMSRDETLGLFHSLGRVFNPKRIPIENTSDISNKNTSMLLYKNTWKLSYNLDSLIDEFATQPMSVSGFLQENYLKYFGDVDDICSAADLLSFSQILLEKWTSEHHQSLIFSLWIAVMGLMVHNEHRVTSWNAIKGPTKITKKQVKFSDDNDRLEHWNWNFNRMDSCYYGIIMKNSNKYPSVIT